MHAMPPACMPPVSLVSAGDIGGWAGGSLPGALHLRSARLACHAGTQVRGGRWGGWGGHQRLVQIFAAAHRRGSQHDGNGFLDSNPVYLHLSAT